MSRWDPANQAWGPRLWRDALRFDGDRLTEIAFQSRISTTEPFVNYQRDVRTYDANGSLLTDTRQDWVDSAPPYWVDNRRAVFERSDEGVFTSQVFERFRDGDWVLDYNVGTVFDASGNRTECIFSNLRDGAPNTYLRYLTAYDAANRPTSVVRATGENGMAPEDSTAIGYSEAGLADTFVRYARDTDAGWVPDTRYVSSYDAQGRLVESVEQTYASSAEAWLNQFRVLYDYRSDGMIETYTKEVWIEAEQAWRGLTRNVFTSQQTVASGEGPAEVSTLRVDIAPNPASSRASLQLRAPVASEVSVDIFDAQGRRVRSVHRGPVSADGALFDLDLSALAPGLYVARAATPEATVTRTFVIAR